MPEKQTKYRVEFWCPDAIGGPTWMPFRDGESETFEQAQEDYETAKEHDDWVRIVRVDEEVIRSTNA